MDFLFVILALTNFLKTVGIIVIVYYALKFIGRLLFPVLVKKAVNNMQARQNMYQRSNRQEGEVTIEKKQKQQNRASDQQGEYVDFEEID